LPPPIASAMALCGRPCASLGHQKKPRAGRPARGKQRARAGGQELSALVDRKHVLAPNQSANSAPSPAAYAASFALTRVAVMAVHMAAPACVGSLSALVLEIALKFRLSLDYGSRPLLQIGLYLFERSGCGLFQRDVVYNGL
jgi:hypothetical protein